MAQLNNLIVTGSSRFLVDINGNLSGNAATATSATSATNATNVGIQTTNPTSMTTYYVPFGGLDNYIALGGNNGLQYQTLQGTSGAQGYSRLILGNSTATGSAGNKEGSLRIYGSGSGYVDLQYVNSSNTAACTFPISGGSVLTANTTSFTQTLTSGTKIGEIKINGFSKDIFAPSVMSSMNIAVVTGDSLLAGRSFSTQNAYGIIAKVSTNDSPQTNITFFALINGTLTVQHCATAAQRTTVTYASGVLTLKCTTASSNALVFW